MTTNVDPEQRRGLERLRDQLAESLAIVEQLLAGPREVDRRVVSLSRTEAIIWTLDHDKVPMSPVQITQRLHEFGRDDPSAEVQTTTFDLWRAGRIAKLERGVYCSNRHLPSVPRLRPLLPPST
jgi:hypothetical protein